VLLIIMGVLLFRQALPIGG